jgi:Cytochrome b5-like Heme/Steroid binding domain
MKFKAYSSVLLTAVLLSAISMPSQAATIAGTKCTKVGTTKTTGGVKYSCIKSGTKLIWNKGTVIKTTPKPSVSATPTPSQSATQSPSPSKSATPSVSSGLMKLTLEEVKKHDSSTSCWSIVYENVFDLTKWITKHPGGAEKIRAICGKDGTSSFERQHTGDGGAAKQLSSYFLGKLGDSVRL